MLRITKILNYFSIIVIVSPKNTSIFISPINVEEKMLFTVNCNAVANPKVTNYSIFSPIGIFQTSHGTLNFRAQNCSSYSGTYLCKASNPQGEGTTAATQVEIYGTFESLLPLLLPGNPKQLKLLVDSKTYMEAYMTSTVSCLQ